MIFRLLLHIEITCLITQKLFRVLLFRMRILGDTECWNGALLTMTGVLGHVSNFSV